MYPGSLEFFQLPNLGVMPGAFSNHLTYRSNYTTAFIFVSEPPRPYMGLAKIELNRVGFC